MNLADDDFALFGLPRRFALDRAELDARWRALQGRAHPDRFAAEGAAAQRVAMQWAVRINEAHQRLKDPLKRAALLCELAGVSLDVERNTAMPRAFLVQQMAWRESLDDAEDDAAAVQSLDDQVAEKQADMLCELETLIDREHDFARAAEAVRALMFVARFRADVEERLEALGQ